MIEGWELINTVENINSYGVLISSGSGTLMEYAALGKSVIIIASNSAFTTNPMPDYGKKIIWDIVYNNNELKSSYDELMNQRKNNFAEIKEISENYLSSYFSLIDNKNIIENFDLNNWIINEGTIN